MVYLPTVLERWPLSPQGCLAPVRVVIPKGSILDPSPEAAVVGGNVLTSQRVVDVILGAFGACAASQVWWAGGHSSGAAGGRGRGEGCGLRPAERGRTPSQRSGHLPLPGLHEQRDLGQRPHGLLRDGGGRRGRGPWLAWAQRRAQPHDQHAHHRPRDPGEQVSGAGRGGAEERGLGWSGGGAGWAEPLAPRRYPVILRRFELRLGSGGRGRFRGGDGVIRELLFREEALLSVLTERRAFQPYGLMGKRLPSPLPPAQSPPSRPSVPHPPPVPSTPLFPHQPPMSLTSLPPGPPPPCLSLQGVSPEPVA